MCSIIVFECIPYLLDSGLQVHLQTHLITAVIFARLWPSNALLNSHDCSLLVHPEVQNMTCTQLQSLNLPVSSLAHHHQVQLELFPSTTCTRSRYMVCRWVAKYYGLRCCDIMQCGVVVLIWVVEVVCKIKGKHSDGTSKYEECYVSGRWIVYKDRLFGIGAFPFFSLYSFSWIAKQVMTLKQLPFMTCVNSSKWTSIAFLFAPDLTF